MVNILSRSLCESCFAEIDTEPCPECGYQRSTYEQDRSVLPIGSVLEGRYMIGRVLGKGGFGITYLAYDMKLGYKVAVKEYYPMGAAVRDTENMTTVSTQSDQSRESFRIGAEKFYSEARLVAELNNNPNIVSVSDVFYENETVYFTMAYMEGMTLKTYLDRHGKISGDQAVYIAGEVSNALIAAHKKNVLHRDISPDNIMVCNDGTVKLLDFGAARQVYTEQSSSLSVILKQGYAPIEQYQKKGKQGPWTDIYALGATLYYSLTLDLLDDPMSRMDDDEAFSSNKHGISPALWEIIKKATMLRTSDRYQDVYDLLDALDDCGITPSPLVKTDDRARRSFGSVSRRKMEYTEPAAAAMNETVALNENIAPAMDATVALNESSAPAMDATVALNETAAPAMNATVALNESGDMNATVALEPDTNYTRPLDNAPDMNKTVALNNYSAPDMNRTVALDSNVPSAGGTSVNNNKKRNIIIAAAGAAALIAIIIGVSVSNSSKSDDDTITAEATTTASVTETTKETTSAAKEAEASKPTDNTDYSKIFTYESSGNGIKITKYIGSDSTVNIPAQIDGKSVTVIGSNAFEKISQVKNVIIPDSVTEIGTAAFRECTGLKSITIPNSVTKIGEYIFYECNDLENVTLSTGITEICRYSFWNCFNLDRIYIPDSITTIGVGAFGGCEALTDVIIPDSVTVIDNGAFLECFSLTSLTIPDKVTYIGTYAFESCTSLEKVSLPASCKAEDNAFKGCPKVNIEIRGGGSSSAEAPKQDKPEPSKPEQSEPSKPEQTEPSKPEQPQQQTPAASNVDYKSLYAEKLMELSGSPSYMFDLYDLNSDGIPELLVSTGDLGVSEVDIYTIHNNKLAKVTNNTDTVLGRYGEIMVAKNKYLSVQMFWMGSGSASYYKIEGTSIKHIVTIGTSLELGDNMEGITVYELDGKPATYDEYKKAAAEFEDCQWESAGRKYDLSESSIRKVLS